MAERHLNVADWIALALVVVGALNWGLVGLFGFNLVAELFGELSVVSRIVYVLVGISGLWVIWTAVKMNREETHATTPART